MIRKWRNRILIYALITVFTAVIGYYIHINYQKTNDRMRALKEDGTLVEAQVVRLDSVTYTDDGEHLWGYVLPIEIERKSELDGATTTRYTKAQIEAMGNKVEVYYIFDEEGNLVTYDKYYVDNFTPWKSSQSIFLWCVGGFFFLCALSYVARFVFMLVILKKGEESIGRFEEAFHPKFGSAKYFKVKYSFIRDGESVTVESPAIYGVREVERLKEYGSFMVKYINKYSFINQRL